MADPVIFDDGGCTRIRQLNNYTMDGLLGIVNGGGVTVFQDAVTKPFANGTGFSCTLVVRHHDKDGTQTVHPNAEGLQLHHDDIVSIKSQNGQVVKLTFDNNFRMVITLTASASGVDPIVEARQNNNQRRYIVSNAGSLDSVVVTRKEARTTIFSVNPAQPSIYTMVHFK
jgi:hypothetical protein